MNIDSQQLRPESGAALESAKDRRPILIVPYMWIGDFVRCHSVVKVLRERFPDRPVDLLATSLCAPLADYMPGVRQVIVADLPRSRLALSQQTALARRLKQEGYGTALTMPRTWKAALAPFLAGIPERVGFAGEVRFILLNDVRFGEKRLPRMVDRCAMLALPRGAAQPPDWPLPDLTVPSTEIAAWRIRRGLTDDRPIVALPALSVPRNVGRSAALAGSPAASRPRAPRSGFWAARARNPSRPKSPPRAARSTSPARICAMPPSRSPPPRLRSRTIPGSCMWRLLPARLRSEFSAPPVHGIGRRSIRWPP